MHELGTLQLVVESGTRKDRTVQLESLVLLCAHKERALLSGKYGEIVQGPKRRRLIGTAMVREKDGCDFYFGDRSKFSKEQTVHALIPWVLLFSSL